MKKKSIVLAASIVLSILLVACGPSPLKLSEAHGELDKMVKAKETAEQTYLDVTDDSLRDKLEELSEREAQYENIDLKKLNDKKIDEILPEIKAITQEYENVGSELSKVRDAETTRKEEKQKHSEIDTYFINKTDMNLSKIVLHDKTSETYSENYLGDGVILLSGYTLMGPSLDLLKASSEWEIIITDENGSEYTLSCEDLKGNDLKGTSITLTYDAQSGSGQAQLGSY